MRALGIAMLALVMLALSGGAAYADSYSNGHNCQGSFISVLGPQSGATVSAAAKAGTRSDSVPWKYAACGHNNGR